MAARKKKQETTRNETTTNVAMTTAKTMTAEKTSCGYAKPSDVRWSVAV